MIDNMTTVYFGLAFQIGVAIAIYFFLRIRPDFFKNLKIANIRMATNNERIADNDIIKNPAFSNVPGNAYYSPLDDPCNSSMPGNIYFHE